MIKIICSTKSEKNKVFDAIWFKKFFSIIKNYDDQSLQHDKPSLK